MTQVLIVDDEPGIREALVMMLEDEGFTLLEAPNGQAALAALQRQTVPMIVVLDRMMPRMTGDDLLRQMAEEPHLQHHRYLLLTAVSDTIPDDVRHLVARYRIPIMRKPFDLNRFVTCVHQLANELTVPVLQREEDESR